MKLTKTEVDMILKRRARIKRDRKKRRNAKTNGLTQNPILNGKD